MIGGAESPGQGKYSGAGAVAPSGAIYFAPCHAVKGLRVSAEGAVVDVGPEMSL